MDLTLLKKFNSTLGPKHELTDHDPKEFKNRYIELYVAIPSSLIFFCHLFCLGNTNQELRNSYHYLETTKYRLVGQDDLLNSATFAVV